jgi:hypothetical protein
VPALLGYVDVAVLIDTEKVWDGLRGRDAADESTIGRPDDANPRRQGGGVSPPVSALRGDERAGDEQGPSTKDGLEAAREIGVERARPEHVAPRKLTGPRMDGHEIADGCVPNERLVYGQPR